MMQQHQQHQQHKAFVGATKQASKKPVLVEVDQCSLCGKDYCSIFA
jgi:hypothetical protein